MIAIPLATLAVLLLAFAVGVAVNVIDAVRDFLRDDLDAAQSAAPEPGEPS